MCLRLCVGAKLDEGMEFDKSENISRLTPPRIMKATTQLLVSVYLFYYLFFHASSSRSYFLFHSLKFYLSAIPLHSLDKRWVFLICNGILVIIANTSGFVSFTPGKLDHNEYQIPHDHHLHAPAAVGLEVFLEEDVQVLLLESAEESGNAESEIHESEHLILTSEEEDHEEGDNSSITMDDHDHEEHLELAGGEGGSSGGKEIRIDITEDDDGDEEYENYYADGFDPWEEQVQSMVQEDEDEEGLMLEKLSAEELNKKFEDFIRKMKEELRIEAQQQHLVVVK